MAEKEESKPEALSALFETKRKNWNEIVYSLVSKVSCIEDIPELQVDMLKYRHDLNDEISKLQVRVHSLDAQLYNKKKGLFIHYATKGNLKLDSFVEKNTMIQADMSESNLIKNLFDTQIVYYKDTRDTIDKIGFAIKNRLLLFKEENI